MAVAESIQTMEPTGGAKPPALPLEKVYHMARFGSIDNWHSFRCVEGRRMRHDPQPDDPYLETDRGQCEECDGKGCEQEPEDEEDSES